MKLWELEAPTSLPCMAALVGEYGPISSHALRKDSRVFCSFVFSISAFRVYSLKLGHGMQSLCMYMQVYVHVTYICMNFRLCFGSVLWWEADMESWEVQSSWVCGLVLWGQQGPSLCFRGLREQWGQAPTVSLLCLVKKSEVRFPQKANFGDFVLTGSQGSSGSYSYEGAPAIL